MILTVSLFSVADSIVRATYFLLIHGYLPSTGILLDEKHSRVTNSTNITEKMIPLLSRPHALLHESNYTLLAPFSPKYPYLSMPYIGQPTRSAHHVGWLKKK